MDFLTSFHQWGDWSLLALRIAVGAIFLFHGKQKWAMWNMQPSDQMSSGMISLMKLLSIVEPLGGLAILLGFLVQPAAVGLGVIMIGAIVLKVKTWGVPFTAYDKTGWEFDMLILAASISLLFLGGGAIGLDRVFFGI